MLFPLILPSPETLRPEEPLTSDAKYELTLVVAKAHIDASIISALRRLDYRWFSNLISQRRQFMALQTLPHSVFNDCFLHLNPEVLQSPSSTTPSTLLQSIFGEISAEFNAAQQKAILTAASMIQSSISPKITMVQGPPGTGKSHTIVGLLRVIFDPRLSNDDVATAVAKKTCPILLCAPSNTAVDQLLLRFANAPNLPTELQQRICRVGRFEAVAENAR